MFSFFESRHTQAEREILEYWKSESQRLEEANERLRERLRKEKEKFEQLRATDSIPAHLREEIEEWEADVEKHLNKGLNRNKTMKRDSIFQRIKSIFIAQ